MPLERIPKSKELNVNKPVRERILKMYSDKFHPFKIAGMLEIDTRLVYKIIRENQRGYKNEM